MAYRTGIVLCQQFATGADRPDGELLTVHLDFLEHLGGDPALTARQPYGANLVRWVIHRTLATVA